MAYVIRVDGEYYRGNTYVHQGETYPALVKREEAKKYKSAKIAHRAADALSRKCYGTFDVVAYEREDTQ